MLPLAPLALRTIQRLRCCALGQPPRPNATRTFETGDDATDPPLLGTYRPRRIILIRHGQSEGNVDETKYVTTPDWKIQLTAKGTEQAVACGNMLSDIVGKNSKLCCYYSPYTRTQQTYETIKGTLKACGSGAQILFDREEPRMVEQQVRTASSRQSTTHAPFVTRATHALHFPTLRFYARVRVRVRVRVRWPDVTPTTAWSSSAISKTWSR